MTTYERIDAILKDRGISRRQLARMAGIKEPTLASVFSKRPEFFPRKYLGPIAEALGVSLDDLEGRSNVDENGDILTIPILNPYYRFAFAFARGAEARELRNATEEEQQKTGLRIYKNEFKKRIDEMDEDTFYKVFMIAGCIEDNMPIEVIEAQFRLWEAIERRKEKEARPEATSAAIPATPESVDPEGGKA